jgi:nucleoside-diphosphate-sugar epimerase
MTVLVTGATGFVGSEVVRNLVAAGEDVAVITLPGSPLHRLDGVVDRVRVLEGDLEDGAGIARLLERYPPDACIHAAWYAEPGQYLTSPRNLDSLRSSLDLLENLARAGCTHVVGVGTCFEYEMQSGPLKEDAPTKPATLYAAAKLAFYLVAAQRAAQLGVGLAWARLFYLYGPNEDERRLVPAAIKALISGHEFLAVSGEQVRDYLHVADVASGLCALSHHRLGGAFNVCSGQPVTVAGLMTTLVDLLGRPELIRLGALPDRDWDPGYVCGDNQRLRTEAHWAPAYSLRDGLAQTISWWKEAGWRVP